MGGCVGGSACRCVSVKAGGRNPSNFPTPGRVEVIRNKVLSNHRRHTQGIEEKETLNINCYSMKDTRDDIAARAR